MTRFMTIGGRWSVAAGFLGAMLLSVVVIARSAPGAVVVEPGESATPYLRLDLPGHTGEVRALAFAPDSSRLYSGGRDKAVIEWAFGAAEPAAVENGPLPRRVVVQQRQRRNVFRWQVGRATRGTVQAIAVSTGNGRRLLAMAGSGWSTGTGEILLVDAVNGDLVRLLRPGGEFPNGATMLGHRQAVTSLDFTADGNWLVSADLDGRVLAWRRADWEGEGDVKPLEVAPRDDQIYPQNVRDLIKQSAAVRRLAVAVGADHAAFAVFSHSAKSGDKLVPIWKIRVVALDGGGAKSFELPGEYTGSVTAMDATGDGRHIAVADSSGVVRRVANDPGVQPRVASLTLPAEADDLAESIALGPDGETLVIGVSRTLPARPKLQVYRVPSWQRIAEREAAGQIFDVRVSPDGAWLAWTGGRRNAVMVEKMPGGKPAEGGEGKPVALGGVGRSITRVAFMSADGERASAIDEAGEGAEKARRVVVHRTNQPQPQGKAIPREKKGPRRIAIATKRPDGQGLPVFDSAFDLEQLVVVPAGQEGWWAPAEGQAAGWTLQEDSAPQPGKQRWRLALRGRKAGFVDLSLDWQGASTRVAAVWLTKPGANAPWAFALAAEGGIFVYAIEADAAKACRFVRRYRGHEDLVQAMAVSEDGRWLASGGRDGMVMFWSLSDLDRADTRIARWGIAAEVRDGKAVVTEVDGAGPLAGRDVRVGDTIDGVRYVPSDEEASPEDVKLTDAGEIVADLGVGSWRHPVHFTTSRGGAGRDLISRVPAWENVAALLVTDDQEWAYWSPRGYHAASANGNTFFGWLVNRGFDRLPRFYRASQFRRRLERPDVMTRILAEGSLDAALRASGRGVPQSSAAVLPEQIAAAPSVRIVSPRPGAAAEGRALEVTAEVETGDGTEIERLRAYASGATSPAAPRLVEDRPAADGNPRKRVYSWQLDLPAEDRHLVQVFAATREGPTAAADVEVTAKPEHDAPRKLFLLAAGVDDYSGVRNAPPAGWEVDVKDLTYAVIDAASLHGRIIAEAGAGGGYSLGSTRLLSEKEMSRQNWREAALAIAKAAKDSGPDDLLVVVLAGHGFRSPVPGAEDGATQFVFCCPESRFIPADTADDPMLDPASGLTWEDFRILADIPCRKLALVDACHSGALAPAVRGEPIRELQENMVLVLAASRGDQESLESPAWGHGLFTKTFLEALDGSGSQPFGETVTLDEAIDHVVAEVPRLADAVGKEQQPTVSPRDLLPYLKIPLAGVQSATPPTPAPGR